MVILTELKAIKGYFNIIMIMLREKEEEKERKRELGRIKEYSLYSLCGMV